jgi:hypothetical protein
VDQTIEESIGICPLCGEEIRLDLFDRKVPAKWRDVIEHRDKWSVVAREFRSRGSIEDAARALLVSPEIARRLLEFLCIEVCGCRAVTCVSCLDDYGSDL